MLRSSIRHEIVSSIPPPTFLLLPVEGGLVNLVSGVIYGFGALKRFAINGSPAYSVENGNFTLAYPNSDVDTAPISAVALLRNSALAGNISPASSGFSPLSYVCTGSTLSVSIGGGNATTLDTLSTTSGDVIGVGSRITDTVQRSYANGVLAQNRALATYWATTTSCTIYSPISNRSPAFAILAFWRNVDIGDELAYSLSLDPMSMVRKRRVMFPTAAPGVPTLSLPTYKPGSLTSVGFQPRVTAS